MTRQAGEAAGQPRNHITGQLTDWYPFRSVQLVAGELDAGFVGAEIAAVEDVRILSPSRTWGAQSTISSRCTSRWMPSSSFSSRWQAAAGDSPISA
jgi:hypothetical protein